MKASDARKLVEKGGNLDSEKLKEIYTIIETKAYVGFTSTKIQANFLGIKPLIEKLKEDGYKCELIDDSRDGDYWLISW